MNKLELLKHLEAMKIDLSRLVLDVNDTLNALSHLPDTEEHVTDMPTSACKATIESLTHTSWHLVDIQEDIATRINEQETRQNTILQAARDDTRRLLEKYEGATQEASDAITHEVEYADTFYQHLCTLYVTLSQLTKEEKGN